MIHECKVQCHTMDPKEMEILGLTEDKGKWLPFMICLDIITAVKLSSDESDSPVYGCTSIFTEHGDTFIIDTPYKVFSKKFEQYHNAIFLTDDSMDEDLEL